MKTNDKKSLLRSRRLICRLGHTGQGSASRRTKLPGFLYVHQWDLLSAYLENGEIEIDNNLVENAMRPLKLGAKNCLRSTSAMQSPVSSSGDRWNDAAVAAEHWLFIGNKDTGERTAVVLTMVENIRRHGYSPRAYLRWVFERLPGMTNQDDLSQLLPDAWIALQQPRIEKCNAA